MIWLRRWALGCAVGRLALIAALCLCFAVSAKASGSIRILTGGYGECYDKSDLNTATSTMEVTATLSGSAATYMKVINSFIIVVNGVTRTAITSWDGSTITGKVTVPITQNPMRLVCYAQANINWSYMTINSESFDSRDSTSDPDGNTGQGRTMEFIYSNIKLRGLLFDGRPCDAYNHADKLVYPITRNTKRYHWFRDNPLGIPAVGSYPAVYLKSTAPQLKIETEALTGSPVRVKATLDATTAFTSGGSPAKPPGYPLNVTQLVSSSNATLALPTLPGYVDAYNISLTLNFECQRSDGTWASIYPRPSDAISLKIYAIHARPNAPMATPWIAVLDNACSWAAGKSSYADVSQKVTTGLYYGKRFNYDLVDAISDWTDPLVPTIFYLTNYLNTRQSFLPLGNCVDISDYLCICANAIGLDFKVAAYVSNPLGFSGNKNFPLYNIFSNPVCLTGSDSTLDSQYKPYVWEFHQLSRSNGGSGGVYDASLALKLDLSGAAFRNPPFNWPWPLYWQNLNTSPSTGLVNYLIDPSTKKIISGTSGILPSTPAPYPLGNLPSLPYVPTVM